MATSRWAAEFHFEWNSSRANCTDLHVVRGAARISSGLSGLIDLQGMHFVAV